MTASELEGYAEKYGEPKDIQFPSKLFHMNDKPIEKVEPYKQGQIARSQYRPVQENPYPVGSLEHQEWQDGYADFTSESGWSKHSA